MNYKSTSLILVALGCAALAGCSKGTAVSACTENPVAREYIETTSYADGDYDQTAVTAFESLETPFRKDQPSPLVVKFKNNGSWKELSLKVAGDKKMQDVIFTQALDPSVDSALVYNLVPGVEYSYKVSGSDGKRSKTIAKGTLLAEGPLRMIRTDGLHNVRDLGGLKTVDGKTLRYGLIYRGGQMNREQAPSEADIAMLKGRLIGLKADVDLRCFDELNNGTPDDPSDDLYYTPLGEGVEYGNFAINMYHPESADTTVWHNLISFMMDCAIEGRPSYVHCAAGADRTGSTCFLLEGVLGVTEDCLSKDYELTSFSIYGARHRNRPHSYASMMDTMVARDGTTLRDKFENYITEYLGISKEKIEAFRAAMLQ